MFYFIRLDIFVCVGVEGWNRSCIPKIIKIEAFLETPSFPANSKSVLYLALRV